MKESFTYSYTYYTLGKKQDGLKNVFWNSPPVPREKVHGKKKKDLKLSVETLALRKGMKLENERFLTFLSSENLDRVMILWANSPIPYCWPLQNLPQE